MAKQNAEQLVQLFEKAHKAAEKAAADGTAADGEEARCLDALKTLQSMQVTTSMLVDTQVGRRLKKLAKHSRPKIAERARMLVEDWRILITTENSAKKGSPAVSKSKKPDPGPPVPLTPVWEGPALKTPQIQKTGNDARDRLAQQLMEALLKVRQEVDPEVRQIVEKRDVARVAGDVEKSVFSELGLSTGVHKAKIRSIMFNLKDAKNPDFRRRVLLGETQPQQLVTMSVEDMASDVRKMENKQIKEKALFECERGLKQAASTDQFKCGKCGQRKTTYFQMQIRSADEPMTTFITCVNCNNRWKMN